ncbi:MAG: right-handed parallel beta-helix repeat-containing protein [Candidatus Hydrogenedentes bacterium]|nr:right-handed parallel beta-helix repeat-containing protein [Candidatus Hydrogenedentota bacterium]
MGINGWSALVLALCLLQGCGPGTEPSMPQSAAPAAPVAQPPVEPVEAPLAETPQTTPAPPSPNEISILPGADAQTAIQEALILAKPGSVVQLEEGVYDLELGLSLDVEGVTIRGRGMDKTVLDFKQQVAGSEGLFVTSKNVVLEDFAVVDTKGNGIKSQGSDNIVIRRVRAEWTGGPKETNGAYGIYPVSSANVLVEDCVAIAGSDSGIYVGQSKNVIVRRCRAEYNVAGIEIENCHGADVYECTATNNTGGILVFDLPDLPQQRGHDIRLLDNKVFANNTPNFAPKGNIVATVPTGTGVMVMANSNVEVFNNEIRDHDTANMLIVSYQSTLIEIKDPNYYPYAEAIHIHDNSFGASGAKPGGERGELIAALAGSPLPDIVWDGIVNPAKLVDGKLPPEAGLYIRNNTDSQGEVTFVSLGGAAVLPDPTGAVVKRDLSEHSGELPALKPIEIPVTQR